MAHAGAIVVTATSFASEQVAAGAVADGFSTRPAARARFCQYSSPGPAKDEITPKLEAARMEAATRLMREREVFMADILVNGRYQD